MMVYPGTDIDVRDADFLWEYIVLYRYKPGIGLPIEASNYRCDSPKEVVEKVRHVKDCDCIMDYVGTFRLDRENHRVISVEVRLAV